MQTLFAGQAITEISRTETIKLFADVCCFSQRQKNRLEKRVKEFSKCRGCFEQLCVLIDLTQCMESVYFKELHKDQILRGIGFRYSEHPNAIWQTTPTRPAFSLIHNILDLIHSKRSLHRFPFFVYLVSIIYFYFYSPQDFIPFYRLLLITIDCY